MAQLSDGNYVLPPGSIAGVGSRQAKPGDTIPVYGVGFGSVSPDIPAGQVVTAPSQLAMPFSMMFGRTTSQP